MPQYFQDYMKKILCLIDGFGSGGAERQMVGLAILLKRKGYYVDLVAYHEEKSFYVTHARQGGIEPIYLHSEQTRWSKLISVRRFIRKQGGYDCIIAYKDGPNAIGCLLKLLGLRFKLIVSERNADTVVGGKKNLFKLYRMANYVVPNSYSKGEFLAKNFPWMEKKIKTITNFTDVVYFSPKTTSLSQKKKYRVLTVGRLTKEKNILNYLDAVLLLKEKGVANLHFDWYGDVGYGAEDYAKECNEKMISNGLIDYFEFHKATPDILKHYQECDLFCLPSLYEGFPNVVCEAMSCGKPIICGDICDNSRIVSEGNNGLLFDPNNVEDMADKLLQMINMSQEQRDQWGKKSREIAVDLLSEESFVNKYISLIEQ